MLHGELPHAVSTVLSDRRYGRFFLAAMDDGRSSRRNSVTIHASTETLGREQEQALRTAIREADGSLDVRVKRYSLETLAAPKSIETFYEPFRHDAILSDPTGAFVRAKELLSLAADLRTRLGARIGKMFWRAESGELFLVVDAKAESSQDNGLAQVLDNAQDILAQHSERSIRRYVKRINVVDGQPSGKVTPVDALSICPAPGFVAMLGIAGKLASAAALLGIGGMMPAQAKTLPNDDSHIIMPGISALPGLTSLGEDAFGMTVLPRAFGGLRVYFGNSEPVLLAKCGLLSGFIPCALKPRPEYQGNGGEGRTRYSM